MTSYPPGTVVRIRNSGSLVLADSLWGVCLVLFVTQQRHLPRFALVAGDESFVIFRRRCSRREGDDLGPQALGERRVEAERRRALTKRVGK